MLVSLVTCFLFIYIFPNIAGIIVFGWLCWFYYTAHQWSLIEYRYSLYKKNSIWYDNIRQKMNSERTRETINALEGLL
eukprot:UN18700